MASELARRLAGDIAHLPGVKSAVVQAGDGSVAGAPGATNAERTAALARFVVARGLAAAHQDDLRGLGPVLAESQLELAAFAGPAGEGLLVSAGEGWAFVALERGASAESVSPMVCAAIRRFTGRNDLAGAAEAGGPRC